MALKCPECGNNTLDWEVEYNLWKCVRMDCGYQRKRKENEKNPHLISIGFEKEIDVSKPTLDERLTQIETTFIKILEKVDDI